MQRFGRTARALEGLFVALVLPLVSPPPVSAQLLEGQPPGGEFALCAPGAPCADDAPAAAGPASRMRTVSNCTDEGKRYEFVREGRPVANVTVPANSRSQPFAAPEGLYDIRIYNAGGYLRTFNYTMGSNSPGIHSGCAEEWLRVNPTHGIKQAGRIVNHCHHDVRVAFWRGSRGPRRMHRVFEATVPARTTVSKVLLSGPYTVATTSGDESSFAIRAQQPWTYEPACMAGNRYRR